MVIVGENSFSSELEFFYYLDTRLNAEDFRYREAILETGATDDPLLVKFLNMGKGGTLAEIKSELDAFISPPNPPFQTYSLEELTTAYNKLSAKETSIQAKAAQALILATTLIDSFDFISKPVNPTQPLQFPRQSITDRNGLLIANDLIPHGIKTATNELAYVLLQDDITDYSVYQGKYLMTSERVGESSKSCKTMPVKKLPDNVLNLIRPYLLNKSDFSSPLTV